MPGGRPPKPLAFHQMTGGDKKNPKRFADRSEPETPGPVGEPPAEWKERAAKGEGKFQRMLERWGRIVAEAPIGLLTASDREFLESVLIPTWYDTTYDWKGRARARKDYAAALKELAMTPLSRAARGMGGKATREGDEQADKLRKFRAARAG